MSTLIGAGPTLVSTPNSDGDVTDGKDFGLGDRHTDHDGKEYVYCQANGAITANDVVHISEAYQADAIETTISASAHGDKVGVSPATFADDDLGWIQVFGPCTANVATSCAANTAINTTATGGRLDDDATSGAEVIDGLVTTGAESSNAAAAILTYPIVGATL